MPKWNDDFPNEPYDKHATMLDWDPNHGIGYPTKDDASKISNLLNQLASCICVKLNVRRATTRHLMNEAIKKCNTLVYVGHGGIQFSQDQNYGFTLYDQTNGQPIDWSNLTQWQASGCSDTKSPQYAIHSCYARNIGEAIGGEIRRNAPNVGKPGISVQLDTKDKATTVGAIVQGAIGTINKLVEEWKDRKCDKPYYTICIILGPDHAASQ